MEYKESKNTTEKIYIIQPITRENSHKYQILREEAVALIESAGAEYIGTIYQNVKEINPATFIGQGKLQEKHSNHRNAPHLSPRWCSIITRKRSLVWN